jgi:RNA polymerase sigma-70 factor (ECF subfamily)
MSSACLQIAHPVKVALYTRVRNRAIHLLQSGSPYIMCRLSLRDIWRKCLDSPADDEVWQELLTRIHPVLLRIARNVAHSSGLDRPEDIDDLVQEICLKISHPASLRSIRLPSDDKQADRYFHATAANAARDALKTRFACKRGEHVTISMEDHLTELADSIAAPAIEREILFRQIDERLQATASERAIFWLYFREGFTSKEIASIPAVGLTSKGVESALQRMTASLRNRLNPSAESKAGDGSSGAG